MTNKDIDKFIVDHWLDMTNAAIAKRVGIAQSTVSDRARRLRLPLKKRGPKANGTISSRQIDDFIIENWREMLVKDIGEKVGLHPNSITSRARRLGLPRKRSTKFYGSKKVTSKAKSDEINQYILDRWHDMQVKDIAKAVGLSDATISSRARRLGLPHKERVPNAEPESEYVIRALARFRRLNMGKWPCHSKHPNALAAWLEILDDERRKRCQIEVKL